MVGGGAGVGPGALDDNAVLAHLATDTVHCTASTPARSQSPPVPARRGRLPRPRPLDSGADVRVDSGEEESHRGSSSDSESDEEAGNAQLDALEKAVRENPSDYDAHVQYIRCLRKLCEMEKLRQARKSMSELFPLSPKMWMEWANDEITLNASHEAASKIEEIYEKGVHEYLSVPLWLDYTHFIEEHDQAVAQCAPAGVSKMRDLYERAICAVGLHVIEGNKIWDAYREFEEAILLTIDVGNNEEKAKQLQRIRALFHRQLSIPLSNLKSTFLTYKHWEIGQGNIIETNSGELDGISASVASAYQKALDMYNARAPYEDQLSSSDTSDSSRLQHFMTYIKFEESSGNPTRVQTLYERAISEFPVSNDLWLGYTSYLDKTLKVPKVLKDVYSRATRNCNWIGTLWVQYILSLERVGASEKELSEVFEQSLQCVFSSFNEYLDLFLTRIDGLRRRISFSVAKEDVLDYSLIRDTFQRAAEYLSSDPISMDDLLHLHEYWARLEINLGKDLVAARGVWESLIKKSGSVLEVWRSYIEMEVKLGNINEARSIYKRCYSKRFMGTGSEDICYHWLRFEREFGSLDDYDIALRKVMPRLQELSTYRLQQAAKTVVSPTTQKDSAVVKPISKKRKTSTTTDKQSSAKRKRDASGRQESHVDSAQKSRAVTDTGMVMSSSTVSPKSADSQMRADRPVGDSASMDDTPAFYADQCTAFVSNLSQEANENHLRGFFSEGGGVTAIRLLRDKFTGRSRGYAYVDFADDEHLRMGIGKNKQKLLGNKLSIARSNPKQSQKRGPVRGGLAGGRGPRAPLAGNMNSEGNVDNSSRTPVAHRRGGHIQLTGKNTFALPRSVRPLGLSNQESRPQEGEDNPKSNDDFRKMLMKCH
uniref:Squamous cell carcinoma antigen recognized by T-cells 3 n=1 Tax=Anthurium amnicola TaxID=1678845 RepID=A0A1D1XXG4_9ARAE